MTPADPSPPARPARPARPGDVAEIVRLAGVMYRSMGVDPGPPGPSGWHQAAAAALVDGLGRGDVAAFVVDDPDRPGSLAASGTCVVSRRLPSPRRPDGLIGYVQWIATDPAHRRQGHARSVMEAIVAWSRDRGVGILELHATAPGEPLYRSLGFDDTTQRALRLTFGSGPET